MKEKRGKPKALLSRQWQSESTLSARAAIAPAPAQASPTPSPTGVPEPCAGAGKPPKSVAWVEEPVDRPAGAPPGGGPGLTNWRKPPVVGASYYCDGETKTWVGRVTKATGQQRQWINPAPSALTDASIEATQSCSTLRLMWDALVDPLTTPHFVNDYAPRDLIQAHEDVHKDISSELTARLAGVFSGAVESLSAACNAGSLSVDSGITIASLKFLEDWIKGEADNIAHKDIQRYLDAHRPICLAWLEKILVQMIKKDCPNPPNLPQ